VHKHGKEERDMNNFKTKLLALVLVLATALGSAPLAVQAAVSAPSNLTFYMDSKSKDMTTFSYIYIYDLSKNSEITNIKSSKKSVVGLESYRKSSYVSTYSVESLSSDEEPYSSNDESYSATIEMTLYKAGTSNITYTIGKKNYTTKVTVKNYTNPLETVEISGLKNGKSSNLKGLVDSASSASGLKLKSAQKDAKINLAAKKGWKISSVTLYEGDYNFSESIYSEDGVSSVTMNPGTLKKDANYTLWINVYNEENGGELTILYLIN
jgi:hypothetical protein